MNIFRTEAIVVKRRNIRESDRILTLFTKDQGKIQVIAKGIRKVPSRRSAHVELLNKVIVSLHEARSLPILTEALSLEMYDEVKADLEKVGFAYHICELIDGLLPENQEHHSIYILLQNTLKQLCHTKDIATTIHSFEVSLLSQLGYWRTVDITTNQVFDTRYVIENILERKLKSHKIFTNFQ